MCGEPLDVLVIEDDMHLRKAYRLTFELEGLKVESCRSLREGMDAFRRRRPEVVWLNPGSEDVGTDWTEVAASMHESEGPPVRLVVVTGDPDRSIRSFCEDRGFRLIWKPASSPESDIDAIRDELRTAQEARTKQEVKGGSHDGAGPAGE